jgi:dihydrofolate reductase
VIGGAQLFAEALPLARRIHLTTIDAEVEGDVLMPPFDRSAFRVACHERVEAGPGQALAYDYERLDRREGSAPG